MFSNILQTSILQIFSKLIYFESAKCSQNILPMIFLSQDLPCQKFSKHSWNKCSSNILQINVAQVLTCQIISKLSCKSPEKFHQDHSSPIPAYTISIMIVFSKFLQKSSNTKTYFFGEGEDCQNAQYGVLLTRFNWKINN